MARNKARAEECKASIVAECGGASASDRVEVVLADLAAQGDVRAAAADIIARFPAVHILVRAALKARWARNHF